MRLLIDLIRAVPETLEIPPAAAQTAISSITADSRAVKPGSLFVALKGEKADGAKFIPQAIQAGAAAILTEKSPPLAGGTHIKAPPASGGGWGGQPPIIFSQNPRAAFAHMAAAFYGKQPETIVAVTGTDGKTSTADFARQLFELLGKKAASIGTLGTIGEGGKLLYPGSHTTPDPVSLHRMLAEMADNGYTHVAMEASSHGLDQYRLHGVRVKAAAFTNFTRDHLDYHKTEEEYFKAKAKLFSEFPLEAAVINVDDPKAEILQELCGEKNISFTIYGKTLDYWNGPREDQRFIINNITPFAQGQKISMSAEFSRKSYLGGLITSGKDETRELTVPLIGGFQIFNMLAAAGLVLADRKHSVEEVLALLPKLKGVPGRLEQVAQLANGASVFIDYAHTPAALANILRTLRPHTQNKLHVVFGCGGDRDAGKRPEMGKAASELADVVIVTDDNPRSENPASIRAAILAASPGAKEVADRKEAIYVALKGLQQGDILVIAGKGHEKTQTVGDKIFPFDDAEVARAGVKELKLA